MRRTVLLLALTACPIDEPRPEEDEGSGSTAPASSGSGPGGVDTTAGPASDSTGHADGPSTGLPGSGSSGWLTTGETMGGPGMAGVYARYEVLDNTGTPVEMWATPICRPGEFCHMQDFEPPVYPCMVVSYVGQQYVGMWFEIESGEAGPCIEDRASWDDVPGLFYLDAACTQPAIYMSAIVQVGGVIYYGSAAAATRTAYTIQGGGACALAPVVLPVSAPTLVPDSILGILPDAPYEITIAY